MRDIIYQYGTAAHLALLTVAPLFLSAFCSPSLHAMALFGLSLFALMWVVMNPSVRPGEWPRDARHRIGWELFHDPFLIFSILALVLATVHAVNGGLEIGYDASTALWQLKGPYVPLLPGSVTGCGVVPLAGIFSLAVATLGVRHALGARSRFAFLLVSGVLAGAVVICGHVFSSPGFTVAGMSTSPGVPFSFGSLLGVYFLFSIVAWLRSWTRKSAFLELICAISASVILAGLLESASTFSLFVYLLLVLLSVVLGVAFVVRRRPLAAWFRTTLSLAIILVPAAALATGLFVRDALWPVLTDGFMSARAAAVSIALEAWRKSPQLGVGIGAYPLSLGFFAKPEDWRILPDSLSAVPCGWIHFLFERGILGSVAFLAGFAILLRDVILRYIRSGIGFSFGAQHLLGTTVVIGVIAVMFVDSSFAQPDALIPAGAALALTAAAFDTSKETDNG